MSGSVENAPEIIQNELFRLERFRIMNELALGSVHDLKNMLSTILGWVQLLSMRREDEQTFSKGISSIEEAVYDGIEIIDRIRSLRRMQGDGDLEKVDLNELIKDVVELLRLRIEHPTRWGYSVEIIEDFNEIPTILGRPCELREVLINIILNAIDAMPNGGKIIFRTEWRGNEVKLSVSDTGVGMPEEVKQRIFEPFFTTKGQNGTGLGMSIVYQVLKKHGGEIEVESGPDLGTTFIVRLSANSFHM